MNQFTSTEPQLRHGIIKRNAVFMTKLTLEYSFDVMERGILL